MVCVCTSMHISNIHVFIAYCITALPHKFNYLVVCFPILLWKILHQTTVWDLTNGADAHSPNMNKPLPAGKFWLVLVLFYRCRWTYFHAAVTHWQKTADFCLTDCWRLLLYQWLLRLGFGKSCRVKKRLFILGHGTGRKGVQLSNRNRLKSSYNPMSRNRFSSVSYALSAFMLWRQQVLKCPQVQV